ncbi:MAG: CheR family methyltransferase [Gallionellaceae bacterium]|nr:CheR family methyltransferase [Gallionellaceae bacterium]
MNVLPILELIREKIGLNPESIGTASVEEIIQKRMKISGSANINDYLSKITGSSTELGKLIESVVVLETFFFRNKISFITLQNYLEQFVLNDKLQRPIRILCIPCATGEEPYSIAMLLLSMKLTINQFHIHAGDISEQALQFSKRAIYSPYSFRGSDLDFREIYFSKQEDSYTLKKEVRDAVHFEQVNILSDYFLSKHEPYDIIFCRNLLIYFDDDIKDKALTALSRHLADQGVLFVGHAEGAKVNQFGYAILDYPMSFAFAKPEYAKVINDALKLTAVKKVFRAHDPLSPPMPIYAQYPIKTAATHAPVKSQKSSVDKETKAIQKAPDDLSVARKLAGVGDFAEVITICDKLLAEGAESAEVYYLLGQAIGSTGNKLMAEEYLKKAIYLNADFYEALIYLSCLFDQMGNAEKADATRKRAERVKLRASKT